MREQGILWRWCTMALSTETCSWFARPTTSWRTFWVWTTMRWHRWATPLLSCAISVFCVRLLCYFPVPHCVIVEFVFLDTSFMIASRLAPRPRRPLTTGIRQSWTPSSSRSQPTSSNTGIPTGPTCFPRSATAPARRARGSGPPSLRWSTAPQSPS